MGQNEISVKLDFLLLLGQPAALSVNLVVLDIVFSRLSIQSLCVHSASRCQCLLITNEHGRCSNGKARLAVSNPPILKKEKREILDEVLRRQIFRFGIS